MTTQTAVHILVIFSCETGAVEQLALAAAVGAVQARADIRLRRIVNPGEGPGTERLEQDYIPPREADTQWADGFVLAVRGQFYSPFLSTIRGLGGVAGKPVMLLAGDQGHRAGETLMGANVLSDVEIDFLDRDGAILLGRRVVETGRARRESSLQEP